MPGHRRRMPETFRQVKKPAMVVRSPFLFAAKGDRMVVLSVLEAILMLVAAGVRRCFTALCGAGALLGAGCAATVSNDATMAEIERLRAAVRKSEERVVAMQAQQAELTQQVRLLTAFVGAMANEAAKNRREAAQPGQGFTGNPPPAEPIKPPDLEF